MTPPTLLAWSLIWALLWTTGSAIAADPDEAPATDAATDSAAAGSSAADVRESTEVFIPSEEISEDFTVSFPVDI
jgi:hypothetical protein